MATPTPLELAELKFGLKVLENPMLRTRAVFRWAGDYLVVHSENALRQMMAGVVWHDSRQGCPSWTEATECRCDVEGAGHG